MRNVDVLKYIPEVVRVMEEIKTIGHIDNIELNYLYQMIEDAMNDQFVYTATEYGIKRWEKMLGIIAPTGSTLEQRRFTILNRLNVRIPYTMNMLRNKLNSMFGNAYSMSLVNDTATLHIILPLISQQEYNETKNMLDVILPANLVLDLRMGERAWRLNG